MLRIGNISEVMQTRTLRVNYGNTQAYPFATTYDPAVYNLAGASAGVFLPGGGSVPGTAGQGPIWPGQVAALAANAQTVCVAIGGTATGSVAPGLLTLGLFANFIGGDFDESGGYTETGVWKGPGSCYEVLSPVYNTNITSTNASGLGTARYLWYDGNGLLSAVNGYTASTPSWNPIAYLLSFTVPKIQIELLI